MNSIVSCWRFKMAIWSRLLIGLATIGIYTLVTPGHGRSQEVDLEIILAVDGSGSITPEEFLLQMAGYAAAFRDPGIQAAATSGPLGKIAVSLMVWSDASARKFPTRWHVIAGPEDANQFALVILNFYQESGLAAKMGGGDTGIGAAVAYGMDMLDNNNITASRQVIDISGDGVETPPRLRRYITLPDVMDEVDRRGITINGLVILTDFPKLDEWYRQNVLRGPGNFVIVAEKMANFAEAIHKKLFREFSHQIAESNDANPGRLASKH